MSSGQPFDQFKHIGAHPAVELLGRAPSSDGLDQCCGERSGRSPGRRGDFGFGESVLRQLRQGKFGLPGAEPLWRFEQERRMRLSRPELAELGGLWLQLAN